MTTPVVYKRACFLARVGVYERGDMPPCHGRLTKAHLIKQQELKRHPKFRSGELKIWDKRVWVWACMDHHWSFDHARTIRVARSDIPEATEQFAFVFDLQWWLDQNYGRKDSASTRPAKSTDHRR